MEAFFDESTFDIEKYCNEIQPLLLDSTLVKPEEDERLVSLVDSPQGSPLSSGPPSPSLPKSEVPSLVSSPGSPFSQFDQFNINSPETMYGMDTVFTDDKKLEEAILPILEIENGTDSLDTWLSNTVSSNIPFVNLSPDEAAALLAGIPQATTVTEVNDEILELSEEPQYAVSEISSTMSEDIDTKGEVAMITEEDLLQLSVKSLNRRLSNYPKDVQKMLKQKRRTLKNRGYAQNCRTKRMKTQSELEQDNNGLLHQLQTLRKQVVSYKGVFRENETMKAELHLLRNEVTNLRQENQCLKIAKGSQ